MARFMVERTFEDGLEVPMTGDGAKACYRSSTKMAPMA